MSFLYTLSNICVPFALISFCTLQRKAKGEPPLYGQWFLLFALTTLFNLFTIFNSTIISLIDLLVKVGLYFLPQSINQKIESTLIEDLRLHDTYESLRCKFLNHVLELHSSATALFIGKLETNESEQYKEGFMNRLQGLAIPKATAMVPIKSDRVFTTSTGSNCAILTEQLIQVSESKLRFLAKEKQELEARYDVQKQQLRHYRKSKAKKQESPAKKEKRSERRVHHPVKDYDEVSVSSSVRDLKQSEFAMDDFEDAPVSGTPARPISEQFPVKQSSIRPSRDASAGKSRGSRPSEVSSGLGLQRRNTDMLDLQIPQRQRSSSPSDSLKEQAQMINKLDLSVSEYSDMFSSEEEGEARLVCKVEAIVGIGVAPTMRLEIYNLELYSNSQLRIMSLFNREFQKHKLTGMKGSKDGYFELQLAGGAVNKRRVKFRGQHQPFLKYLTKTD